MTITVASTGKLFGQEIGERGYSIAHRWTDTLANLYTITDMVIFQHAYQEMRRLYFQATMPEYDMHKNIEE